MRTSLTVLSRLLLLIALAAPTAAAAPDTWGDHCWERGWVPPGLWDDPYPPTVYDIVDDDGRLYVCGDFTSAGGVEANHIAMWDGREWHALDEGSPLSVGEIEHSGTYLYAVGSFDVDSPSIARWSGGNWQSVGEEVAFNGAIEDILYDGGVYIAGSFTMCGEQNLWRTAVLGAYGIWEQAGGGGLTWQGYNYGTVYDLEECRGDIWAGGDFDYCHPYVMPYLARMVEGEWTLPEGMGAGLNERVTCLENHDGVLFIGGRFTTVDGTPSLGMAYWSGALSGISAGNGADHYVKAFASLDGQWLRVATANSVRAYGRDTPGMPKTWHDIHGDIKGVEALTFMGYNLYAAGALMKGSAHRDGVAVWHADGWRRLGNGLARNHTTVPDYVNDFALYDGGLVAGGYFDIQAVADSDLDSHNIGLFDGTAWLPLGSGFVDEVQAVEVYDGDLYACGEFDYTAAPVGGPMNHIARWNPDLAVWESLADGLNGHAYAMCVWEGKLVVGGLFTQANNSSMHRVAAWDGGDFSPLGLGCNATVRALCSYENNLIVAGQFTEADGAPANRIAMFTGAAWLPLGDGFDDGIVSALAVHDGDLYAGGSFTASGGAQTRCLARWTGGEWVEVGGGVTAGAPYASVFSLHSHAGHGLYVGGWLDQVGAETVSGIALWREGQWWSLGSGLSEGYGNTCAKAIIEWDGYLMLGGNFKYAGGTLSASVAQWSGDFTPVLLCDLSALPTAAGVRIDWRVEDGGRTEFRLSGRRGGLAWDVDHASLGGGAYTALDATANPADGAVTYELAGREPGGAWLPLGRRTVLPGAAASAAPTLGIFPNPGNPTFRLSLDLPVTGPVAVAAYDVRGRRLRTLYEGVAEAGELTLNWNGTDAAGRDLSAGVYLIRLSTRAGSLTKRAVILR